MSRQCSGGVKASVAQHSATGLLGALRDVSPSSGRPLSLIARPMFRTHCRLPHTLPPSLVAPDTDYTNTMPMTTTRRGFVNCVGMCRAGDATLAHNSRDTPHVTLMVWPCGAPHECNLKRTSLPGHAARSMDTCALGTMSVVVCGMARTDGSPGDIAITMVWRRFGLRRLSPE